MNMQQQLISKINGVDIVTVDRDGDVFVPIKPICVALGIEAHLSVTSSRRTNFLIQLARLSCQLAPTARATICTLCR